MASLDIVKELVNYGVSEDDAIDLKSRLSGEDYVSLVTALDNQLEKSYKDVSNILKRYKVKTFESMVSFKSIKKITENTHFNKPYYDRRGLEFFVDLGSSDLLEDALNVLDEMNISYDLDGLTRLAFGIDNLNHLNLLDEAFSKMINKIGDQFVAENKFDKRAKEAKKKLDNFKPHNPIAGDVVNRHAGAIDKVNQKKIIPRKAKHKPKFFEEFVFELGDKVNAENKSGTVSIPNGPNDTVGVIINGELTMFKKEDVTPLVEGVLGMTNIDPLIRLKELAGLSSSGSKPVEEKVEPVVENIDSELDDICIVDDLSIAPDLPDVPLDADMPGEVESMPAVNERSSAIVDIENSIAGIRELLADVRISEYKTLVSQLQDLTDQARSLGRSYLGESK